MTIAGVIVTFFVVPLLLGQVIYALTRGKPTVTQVIAANGVDERKVHRLAAAAEVGSEHPLAEAIVERARAFGLALPAAQQFAAVSGRGIRAIVEDHFIVLGNRAFMAEQSLDVGELGERAEALARTGATPMYVGWDGRIAGIIAVAVDRP